MEKDIEEEKVERKEKRGEWEKEAKEKGKEIKC